MTIDLSNDAFEFTGTAINDIMGDGFNNIDGAVLSVAAQDAIRINGNQGDDEITTGRGNDLAAGDMVGAEWTLVDGTWTYNQAAVVHSTYGANTSFNDIITTGAGNDVLLGNGGNDLLFSGAGNDIVNAGSGNDRAFAGLGNDTVNLEQGNDYAEAGLGNDIVNGGAGNDVIYGDLAGDNLLARARDDASTFTALAQGGAWAITDNQSTTEISQSAATVAGKTYTIAFDLAANFSAGNSSATVEVIWNGEVVDTVETTSGAYETFEVDVVSTGNGGALSFRAVEGSDGISYNFDGPIISYETTVSFGGDAITVDAFAAGQSNLYQVINGQLNVFDAEKNEYTVIGDAPDLRINAVGFNIEDNLIYGVAKSSGLDALGNQVNSSDIVMIDASGDAYRVGDGFYGDYVGDFDAEGNLWTFHSGLNRISVVDVDNFDADGNPVIQHFHFPSDMFTDRTYDIAFNAEQNCFLAVVAPDHNGGHGRVVRIDTSTVTDGGTPTFSELEITGTLHGDTMLDGMPRGAYGAVFFDADGNLYFGLNNGDHDLDQSTSTQGGIFRINMDWHTGEAFAEFMAETVSTGSNDGAVDPRSADAFAEIDAEAAVLLRGPTLTQVEGGNDTLRGGEGNDEIYGNAGADDINGGAGNDMLSGDQGDDLISGGSGNDELLGGEGNDSLRGEAGDDALNSGEGSDYLAGGSGDDALIGGAGTDKIVGGTGADEIHGGAGNDKLWGGNWSGDSTADTFVFEAGDGQDFVFDFEAGTDILDLSAFGTDLAEVTDAARDEGWATIIDLSQLAAGQAGDQITLLSAELAALESESFIF
ncbi:calcium-binding protein [uncultured Sulfitobacter sp.]|uniref:calcium-binding protein n=1 Tax=uncultured Sulfitobacter sp. TaxID=191468 RepID=UPI0026253905|nr:calcium-binding protein [uncultured Sulfitobacter sp.]